MLSTPVLPRTLRTSFASWMLEPLPKSSRGAPVVFTSSWRTDPEAKVVLPVAVPVPPKVAPNATLIAVVPCSDPPLRSSVPPSTEVVPVYELSPVNVTIPTPSLVKPRPAISSPISPLTNRLCCLVSGPLPVPAVLNDTSAPNVRSESMVAVSVPLATGIVVTMSPLKVKASPSIVKSSPAVLPVNDNWFPITFVPAAFTRVTLPEISVVAPASI